MRYPRPSRLAQPLRVEGAKAEHAASTLGLVTIGDLLEHLPRDRREARAVSDLAPGETATVVVSVRSIASRPVRRRGMRPLVEATVADDSGPMKATFFNQPWLVQKYPAETGLVLHGKYEARNRFRVQGHARTSEGGGGDGAVAHYAATEGLSSTQILALVRAHGSAIGDVPEPLPARLRVRERLPERRSALAAVISPAARTSRARAAAASPSRSSCWPSCAAAPSPPAPAGGDRGGLDQPRELTARWLATMLPFIPTADQIAPSRSSTLTSPSRSRCSGC